MNNKIIDILNSINYNITSFSENEVSAINHETNNKLQIYNNIYPLKYNLKTGKIITITNTEEKAIKEIKNQLGWIEDIQVDYEITNSEHSLGFKYRDYSFYKKEIDIDRVNTVLLEVISQLSFTEICKMFREICYDQVCYYSEEHKGIIYEEDRSQLNKEQACRLQRKVSTAVDLFEQSVVRRNEFNEDYLTERLGN